MTKIAAIIGGGVIGGGWAARFALMGWEVRVFDPDPEAERKIGEVMGNAARVLPMLYEAPMPTRGAITYFGSVAEAVTGADWIQESVPERLDIKHRVIAEIQAACPAEAVLASSTSGFKPSELQEGAARPGQIMVAHPFNPVYLLPLIELVPSAASDAQIVDRAKDILTQIGMYPLHVRAEIDAHIADRFLEAVWREALWLVKDGIATTEEIDNAIRYGFGLRWAQMGLFETYRVAGGEAGMRHFMAQFGPCLQWPWTKLTDVPEFTDELVDLIAGQSDAQSGHMGIRDLERLRDNNLVAILRALKQQGAAAGKLILDHDTALRGPLGDGVPLVTVRRVVPVDWTDINGHMNEGRYGQLFSDASEELMTHIGADRDYIAAGNSYFTAETSIKYLNETHAGEDIYVTTRVMIGQGKKLKLWHQMHRASDEAVLATCDQFLLHVSLETRRSCPPLPQVLEAVERLAASHAEVSQ
ncbi:MULTISPECIES: carnitine 3-dehydrogenase [Marivita]|uniref:L-carnitine dehydrogenase n=1 Tax=Marivita cryptomonadis TaxID=505252 RepID=A0A9Q2NSQ3_9RHOB|nr:MULTISPECIES: carnitine 3-dehydrogenase [Marivita]MCR9170555.1 carnitine 3-dehydrogenase [Paracoccaceae bacterium]MBM2322026.1 carnitine 3-dehydrogenase [Marivita cryptomonadis]MBM2331607.1 carnitine 3-dehydrogenase [Marivita cryptomonadis]MBM2341192.1 carnitine 3-dehydrogenase [Marivita cryptomonadis]MBM2345855.1 carnitine 3-dehydrogenase [Marivita cryptomonadis]